MAPSTSQRLNLVIPQIIDGSPAHGSAAIKFKRVFGHRPTSLKPLAAMSLVCNILQLIKSCRDIINIAKTALEVTYQVGR